jgi:hypothetical protein
MTRLVALALLAVSPAAFAQQAGDTKPSGNPGVKMGWWNLVEIQLREKGCWNEPAIPREGVPRVAFRVHLAKDGHFSETPELITSPESLAANPSLQALADRARAALETCNAKGFDLPPRTEGVERNLTAVLTFPGYMVYKLN